MRATCQTLGLIGIASAVLVGCGGGSEQASQGTVAPRYTGIETILLDGDLVNFRVEMTGARDNRDVAAYAACAAAQYALIRGFGFARHVRTNVDNQGGTWRGDAVYTISAALPEGLKTIDAEVTVRDCAAQGIPTV
ncbi:hypothetical protein [Tabrizicola oligotrophica]|uniref:Lipoprotein n=1 Tax=Tabrizicola oligotrophica TaxID=2710650 RepID=A0A6M0QN19_9RHOB|nr:hypothetical protein [Tabrizicola oligotrophica]NEY88860.1 hypothetical protein [Tabrizicola oligotrophica]